MYGDDFSSGNPSLFFSTAAGPDALDLYGPPQSTLDIYADGSPLAASETAIAQSVGMGSGGGLSFMARPDVHALCLLIVGAAMVHLHMESD